MKYLERVAFVTGLLLMADPALAGTTPGVPAPIAGVGIGAVALIGLGYRAMKSRINR